VKGKEYNITTHVKILREKFWVGQGLSRMQAVVGCCEEGNETSIFMRREFKKKWSTVCVTNDYSMQLVTESNVTGKVVTVFKTRNLRCCISYYSLV
jgi:predicted NUDIX family NTP pyrophosphohydrolase